MADSGLFHDVVGCVPRLAIERNRLVVSAVRPNFMRAFAWAMERVPMLFELLDDLLVEADHAAQETGSEIRISVFARAGM